MLKRKQYNPAYKAKVALKRKRGRRGLGAAEARTRHSAIVEEALALIQHIGNTSHLITNSARAGELWGPVAVPTYRRWRQSTWADHFWLRLFVRRRRVAALRRCPERK